MIYITKHVLTHGIIEIEESRCTFRKRGYMIVRDADDTALSEFANHPDSRSRIHLYRWGEWFRRRDKALEKAIKICAKEFIKNKEERLKLYSLFNELSLDYMVNIS